MNIDVSCRRFKKSQDGFKKCTLARSIRSYNRREHPWRHVEVNVPKDGLLW
jgi:hypothetical protein